MYRQNDFDTVILRCNNDDSTKMFTKEAIWFGYIHHSQQILYKKNKNNSMYDFIQIEYFVDFEYFFLYFYTDNVVTTTIEGFI